MTDGIALNENMGVLYHQGYAMAVSLCDVSIDKLSFITRILIEVLGQDYDITLYPNYIQIEYQRYLDDIELWINTPNGQVELA